MSFWTAFQLSLNNLMTKKGRTFLTAFAGSIGIIGIGLIMSLSNGVQNYINSVENDTMASYPISIEDNSLDMSVLMSAMMDMDKEEGKEPGDTIRSKNFANKIIQSISQTETNNLSAFKTYLESSEGKEFQDLAKAIEYKYNTNVLVYNDQALSENSLVQVSPNGLMDRLGMGSMMQMRSQFMPSDINGGNEVWLPLPKSKTLLDEEYDVVDGRMPSKYNEVVLEVDQNNEITDYALYSLGLMDQDELVKNYEDIVNGKTKELQAGENVSYTKEELLNKTFKLVLNPSLYEKKNGVWVDQSENEEALKKIVANGEDIHIVGIVKPKEKTVNSQSMGGIYYDPSLIDYINEKNNSFEIVKEQKAHKDINVFTGQAFSDSSFSIDDLSDEQKMMLAQLSESELMEYMSTMNANTNASYDSNLLKLGVFDPNTPSSINIYASSFEDKETLGDMITQYNELQEVEGKDENVISYNDMIGVMLSGVSDVINMISYVLIGFVSVSLIVSSIMIGIITYISVLERKKEIGILRAMGASKKDVSHVFNAETFIIGLISGLFGILFTIVLNIPISMIVEHFTQVEHIASLPWQGGLFLVLINLALTMLAGLIPARMASKKDPVEALRSE